MFHLCLLCLEIVKPSNVVLESENKTLHIKRMLYGFKYNTA